MKVKVNPYKYCGYCGTKYITTKYPLHCNSCQNKTYKNPKPVAIGILRFVNINNNIIDTKSDPCLLLIRRNIEPCIGGLCFPGGYIETIEDNQKQEKQENPLQKAIKREIMEETGIDTSNDKFKIIDAICTPDNNHTLIFGLSDKIRTIDSLPAFIPNDEVSELVIGDSDTKICFSIHQYIYDKIMSQKE